MFKSRLCRSIIASFVATLFALVPANGQDVFNVNPDDGQDTFNVNPAPDILAPDPLGGSLSPGIPGITPSARPNPSRNCTQTLWEMLKKSQPVAIAPLQPVAIPGTSDTWIPFPSPPPQFAHLRGENDPRFCAYERWFDAVGVEYAKQQSEGGTINYRKAVPEFDRYVHRLLALQATDCETYTTLYKQWAWFYGRVIYSANNDPDTHAHWKQCLRNLMASANFALEALRPPCPRWPSPNPNPRGAAQLAARYLADAERCFGSPNSTSTAQQPADCSCVDPGTVAVLAQVRQSMQQLQAKTDALGSDFLSGTVAAFTTFTTLVAQPAGQPGRDAWNGIQALIQYFTTNDPNLQQQVSRAAFATARDVQKRPLYYAGILIGPNVACGIASGAVKSCTAATRLSIPIAQEATAIRAATQEVEVAVRQAEALGNPKWFVPGLKCPGCLVYGTASGGYAQFAESVGGYTINSLAKPDTLSWEQFSAKTLESALSSRTPVLFSLNGMEKVPEVLAGKAYLNATTSYELRYLQRNWNRFQGTVRFYNDGAEVPPPWQ